MMSVLTDKGRGWQDETPSPCCCPGLLLRKGNQKGDGREAWREAVGEMMEGLEGPQAVEDEPGWGAALGPAGVWWSGHRAKKGKILLTDLT